MFLTKYPKVWAFCLNFRMITAKFSFFRKFRNFLNFWKKENFTVSVQSSTSEIRNFKVVAILCDCTVQFVSDLVCNPEDRFSHTVALLLIATFVMFRYRGYYTSGHFI